MNSKEFFFKVKSMREAQQRYEKMRTSVDYNLMRKLEKNVDDEIEKTVKGMGISEKPEMSRLL